ncbi:MAG: FtsX-like permease family protein [Planctomycetota bacterium]
MKLPFALKLAAREVRGGFGRLAFFVGCLAAGVAGVVGVESLVQDINKTLQLQARALLAADLSVESRRPLPDALAQREEFNGRERCDVVELPTMASVPETAQARLVEVWALDGRYPFYGTLALEPALPLPQLLTPNHVVVAPELLREFALAVGDTLRIGGAEFAIAGTIAAAPERLDFSLSLGPKVLMNRAGLDRTALLGFGSRVRYKALFYLPGVERAALQSLGVRLKEELPEADYLQIETYVDAQPAVREAIGRFERFLGLVALLSLLLGGLGIAQVIRTWIARRTPALATLRCLGVRQRDLVLAYVGQVIFFAVCASLVGAVAGGLLAAFVPGWLADAFAAVERTPLHIGVVLRGTGLGILVATGFAIPPLLAIWRVPPSRVLRASAEPLPLPWAVRIAAPIAIVVTLFATAALQGADTAFAAAFTGIVVGVSGLLWIGARLLMYASSRVPRHRLSPAIRTGVAALGRPAAGVVGGTVALGLGVLVVLGLYLVEDRLGGQLRSALPARAPSTYLWDVQPKQWPALESRLAAIDTASVQPVPVVMARLRSIDGKGIQELQSDAAGRRRAPWALTREQRITWFDAIPSHQEIVAGKLWHKPAVDEVSLDADFAVDIGAGLGSVLEFDIDGVRKSFEVTSLRAIDWQSFAISFFLVAEPGSLAAAPQVRMIGIRLDDAAEQELQRVVAADFPNVTVIRVRGILERVQSIMTTLAAGVRLLGSFTIAVGIFILGGAIAATQLRRAAEVALLKALGVSRGQIVTILGFEFALVGLVAGCVGAGGAYVLAGVFLDSILELRGSLPIAALPVTIGLASVLATAAGLGALVPALRAAPLATLKRG